MNQTACIEAFLNGSPHAVVGASADRTKYGNMVLRCYQQKLRDVFPINPKANIVEGCTCYPELGKVPVPIHGISIITPTAVTEKVLREAGALGIRHVWMQPGAESEAAIALAENLKMNVIAGGPCILVVLGFKDL